MALTPEQEAAVIALISKTQKTISQLEAETALTGDKILPVENSDGTFALTVDDLKNYIVNNFPDASTTAKGIIQLATNAEVIAGTNTNKAITPSSLQNKITTSFFQSSPQTITLAGSLTLPHGLGSKPVNYQAFLVCVNPLGAGNYSLNDELLFQWTSGDSWGLSIVPDATKLNIKIGSATPLIINKLSGTAYTIGLSDWKLIFRAWKY